MAKKNKSGNREPRKPKKQKAISEVDNSVSVALQRKMPGSMKSGQPKMA